MGREAFGGLKIHLQTTDAPRLILWKKKSFIRNRELVTMYSKNIQRRR